MTAVVAAVAGSLLIAGAITLTAYQFWVGRPLSPHLTLGPGEIFMGAGIALLIIAAVSA